MRYINVRYLLTYLLTYIWCHSAITAGLENTGCNAIRTIFFGAKIQRDRLAPETADTIANQRDAVDRDLVASERRKVW